ncbi:glucosaminidase domain-containing protein [Natronospira sp.]|uniref:glucosaminidase domain-containing protein n=1 Tax=Natronospira sp. TaxID=2024970 RepID=UPI003872C3DC
MLSGKDIASRTLIPAIPLLTAVAIVLCLQGAADDHPVPQRPELRSISVDSPQALHQALQEYDFQWPPEQRVPAVAVESFPTGMAEQEVNLRKSLFFRSLLPLILAENEKILAKREELTSIHEKLERDSNAELSDEERTLVEHLQQRFRVEGDIRDIAVRDKLFRRIDVIPPSLALSQAANESGWGTSRFTREANNLFGEWTWNEEVGLVPQQRREGATHFVRVFPDLHASVRSYIHNLNIGHAYTLLRQLRAEARQAGRTATGMELAQGLERYSERGQDYIREVRSMILQNDLHELPEELELVSEP